MQYSDIKYEPREQMGLGAVLLMEGSKELGPWLGSMQADANRIMKVMWIASRISDAVHIISI